MPTSSEVSFSFEELINSKDNGAISFCQRVGNNKTMYPIDFKKQMYLTTCCLTNSKTLLIICHIAQGARQARSAGKTTATPNNRTTEQMNIQSSVPSTKSGTKKQGGNSLKVGNRRR